MFTKQHYQAIAAILRDANSDKRQIAENLADYFSSDNPHFDKMRFLSACGFSEVAFAAKIAGIRRR